MHSRTDSYLHEREDAIALAEHEPQARRHCSHCNGTAIITINGYLETPCWACITSTVRHEDMHQVRAAATAELTRCCDAICPLVLQWHAAHTAAQAVDDTTTLAVVDAHALWGPDSPEYHALAEHADCIAMRKTAAEQTRSLCDAELDTWYHRMHAAWSLTGDISHDRTDWPEQIDTACQITLDAWLAWRRAASN